ALGRCNHLRWPAGDHEASGDTRVRPGEVRARPLGLEHGDALVEEAAGGLRIATHPVEMRELGERSTEPECVVEVAILREGTLLESQRIREVACVPRCDSGLREGVGMFGVIVRS